MEFERLVERRPILGYGATVRVAFMIGQQRWLDQRRRR
jgi:hypothetical protein